MYSSSESRKLHAISLPEISSKIAYHLSAADVLSCSAVNRTFYIAFSPVVWKDLHLGRPCNHTTNQASFARNISLEQAVFVDPHTSTPSSSDIPVPHFPEVLRSKTRWTRSLSIHSHDSVLPLQLGRHCFRLNAITVDGLNLDGAGLQRSRTHWAFCKKMIKRNRPQLRSLTLNNWTYDRNRKIAPGERVWNPISSCNGASKLQSLTLHHCQIRRRHMDTFWSVCTTLESLDMLHVELDLSLPPGFGHGRKRDDSSKNLVRFPKLKELSIREMRHRVVDQLYLVICYCPMLQLLKWQVSYVDPTSDFAELFLTSTWPDLSFISIVGNQRTFTEERYRQMLLAFKQPIRWFDVKVENIRFDTIEMFQPHFSTLQAINIVNCPHNTSGWVIQILTRCPGLQKLKAKIVTAESIIRAKPWACCGLEEMKVFIDMRFFNRGPFRKFTAHELGICRSVFRRIAEFKRLRILDMLSTFKQAASERVIPITSPKHSRNFLVPLPLRLKAGLDLLENLTMLEEVSFWGVRNKVRMEELLWMVNHWRSLHKLAGGWEIMFETEEAVQDKYLLAGELCDWLGGRGITTTDSWYYVHYPDVFWIGAEYVDCCDSD